MLNFIGAYFRYFVENYRNYYQRKLVLMKLTNLEKNIKKKREVLSAYVLGRLSSWRRIYPETFYRSDSFVSKEELDFIGLIYEIFQIIIAEYKKTIIEDEINLIYAEIDNKTHSKSISEVLVSAIKERFDLKKPTLNEIQEIADDVETAFKKLSKPLSHIRFRLESTTYLVRLLAYGLFTDNDIVFDRVAEVFDVEKLKSATEPKDKQSLDNTLKFLYKGLIQKNESGRQGSRRAARQTIDLLRQWYLENEYVLECLDKIEKYV